MKLFNRFIFILCLSMTLAFGSKAANYAWPANWEGVMLQGFYWDSYTDTKWTNLTAQSDELSSYFKLIWVPNSARAASNPGMGYDPVYWFTNHNTRFGTEAELREMIKTFKEKGTGIIEDVVVNHRSGKSNWTNFPAEEWNGRTWQLGPEHICSTDEVRNATGQAKPTGAPDTGENFDGSRDLDHTNATVQDNIKNYCKFLLEDMGYTGFRYDMAKGYAGRFTKIYNEYSKPTFSVGEYWDGYDAIAAWIEATGRQSAAFDFPFKYAVRDAFSSGDMSKLVWLANGSNPQPAGMIHFGYSQYAVTFIDNHDTSRDDNNKFSGNVVAANAFMLMSPGTPCVYLPHYKANKQAIQRLINIRNSVGLHNNSAVNVLQTNSSCYMAEVTGSKGKLVVKIGPAMVSPSGYTDSDIVASGDDYCIWTKVAITGGNGGGSIGGGGSQTGDPVTIYFDNTSTSWTAPHIHYWGGEESTWPGVAMSKVSGNIYKYDCPAGTTGCLFNAGDGDATKTQDFVAVHNHLYTKLGDQGVYPGSQGGGGSGNTPAKLYLLGDMKGNIWNPAAGVPMTKKGNTFVIDNVVFEAEDPDAACYFNLTDALGATWDDLNNAANRWGAAAEGEELVSGTPATMKLYANNVNASGCLSWSIPAGEYSILADFSAMTIKVTNISSGISTIGAEAAPVVYYNLQGVRVNNPQGGIFIRRQGSRATKVRIP